MTAVSYPYLELLAIRTWRPFSGGRSAAPSRASMAARVRRTDVRNAGALLHAQ